MRSKDSRAESCNNDGEWHVAQCACGQLTLRIGTVRLEFSRDQFAQLHRLVLEAMTEFQIAPTARPVYHVDATRH